MHREDFTMLDNDIVLSNICSKCKDESKSINQDIEKETLAYEEDFKTRVSDNKITVDGNEITNDTTQAVYSSNDIIFYLEGQDFKYGEGTKDDEHSQAEADAHTVVHITKPGRYVLSGNLSAGQIAVDLGEDGW